MHTERKHIILGLLAHVDAGKTTLAEGILYSGGVVRAPGRVDHGDAFLDHFRMERERGITIFSKQAQVTWKGLGLTLLDTPGHVDFSAETERALQVLDYAVLVISGTDGVQGHTRTLWRLLEQYGIPTFLFVNKMDLAGTEETALLKELQMRLGRGCVKFTDGALPEETREEIAASDEILLERYLETGEVTDAEIAETVCKRRIFPVYFGAALRLEGVDALLDGLERYCAEPEWESEFAARVYKISRDADGTRLTHLKVTGGALRVKQLLEGTDASGKPWQEKADHLRIYHGERFTTADEVCAGMICAVTGPTATYAGEGLGAETGKLQPSLRPVLTYRVKLPEGADPVTALGMLRRLEEEEPLLRVLWNETVREIRVQVMGEIQLEILQRLLTERFGLDVTFDAGSIVYQETIAAPVIGIGHFEPLRHYAEVQLLLEPGEPGSGLQFDSAVSTDMLDRNWQRLILTHLEEKTHRGVLTGAPVTDLRIVLVAGRAHPKHTEGGDFRQATWRAVRQGLRQAQNVLLEPFFAFTLEVPTAQLGRAMADVQRMSGSFEPPETNGETGILTGRAPVATFRDYQREVNAYTHGTGKLSCVMCGYASCHNPEEVIAAIGYDPDADTENTADSVFCAHGAGYIVHWDQVAEHAHLPLTVRPDTAADGTAGEAAKPGICGKQPPQPAERVISQEEINAILGQNHANRGDQGKRRRRYHVTRLPDAGTERKPLRKAAEQPVESYLLVDGYNIIFAWEELRELAAVNLDGARDRLMDILCDYQATLGSTLILVFDAYQVKGNPGSVQRYHNIYVVYTREAETADQYIEKTVHAMALSRSGGNAHHVTVATSDGLEQRIILGNGALRQSARELEEAVRAARQRLREQYLSDPVPEA